MNSGMSRKNAFAIGALVLCIALSGCCENQTKADGPPPVQRVVGLADAISQVQEAVYEARKVNPDHKIGVMASKVTLNLKLTATDMKTETGGYSIGVALGPIAAGTTNTRTNGGNDAAESSITLELVNPYLADKDTLLGVLAANEKTGVGNVDLRKLQINLKTFKEALMDIQMSPDQARPDK